MIFTDITIKALALGALMIAPALAGDQTDAGYPDVEVKYWDSTSCKKSGPQHSYKHGECMPVPNSTKAVSIQKKRSSCYVIRYKGGNCDGEYEKLPDLDDCYSLEDPWNSIKFKCDD